MKRIYSVFKYMARETARTVALYYLAICVIYMLLLPMILGNAGSSVKGMEAASLIFLFVVGLNIFKASFLFSQANGVTRRHFYAASLMTVAAASLVVTVVDALLYGAMSLFLPREQSLFSMLYPVSGLPARLLWTLTANLACTVTGWFITLLYYRSGKPVKLLISIVPPIFLSVGLPVLNNATGGRFLSALGNFFAFMLGLGGSPKAWAGSLGLLALAAVLSGLCFLLVRRAPVKDQSR